MHLPVIRLLIPLALIGLFTGCLANSASHADGDGAALREESASRTVQVRGRVVEVRRDRNDVLIDHEAIPGEMAAMTMPFSVRNPEELDGLEVGDAITFRYTFGEGTSWIADIALLPEADAATLKLAIPASYDAASDVSLYEHTSEWTSQAAESVRLADLAGHPVFLSMIFTNCAYACPLIVRQMKDLTDQMPVDVRERVRYVLVSLDPERDTSAALRRFAKGHGLDSDRWTLLRGSPDDVRMLAAMLGMKYRSQADGQFAHTSLIAILNEEGEIVYRHEGTGAASESAGDALLQLLATLD